MVSYLATLFLGKSPEVSLPVHVHVLSAHFSPVTGRLLFLKQLIPKREIDFKQNNVPDTKTDNRTTLCDAYTLPTELVCPVGPWDMLIIPPANCVCGRVYCFHVVRPNKSVSVTFCFLNILKSY